MVAALSSLAGVSVGGDSPVRLLAVVNVSPESFYPGSVRRDAAALRDVAQRFADEGADWIDIGAMSTAPYLETFVDEEEETRRLAWATEVVRAAVTIPLSADTSRAAPARAALAAGAAIINDVRGLGADADLATVAAAAAGVILMASQDDGPAATPVARVRRCLTAALARADTAGIARDRIVLDPGIGFFPRSGVSSTAFNCAVLRSLEDLADLERPLLVGVSRKSFLGELSGRADPAERLPASLAAAAIAVYHGAAAIRTHDVAATRDAVRVAAALRSAST